MIELNRAIAVAMDRGPEAGLELIDAIEGLDRYAPYHVSRADLLGRLGRGQEAIEAYRRGLELSTNPVQRGVPRAPDRGARKKRRIGRPRSSLA